jgi:hypothetical protein
MTTVQWEITETALGSHQLSHCLMVEATMHLPEENSKGKYFHHSQVIRKIVPYLAK